MSNRAINWAVNIYVGSSIAKTVLFLLANRADKETFLVWSSVSRLAREAELSNRSVFKALNTLKRAGLIHDTGRRTGYKNLIRVYRINADNTAPRALLGADEYCTSCSNKASNTAPPALEYCTSFTQNHNRTINNKSIGSSKKKTKRKKHEYTAEFERAWKVYPRRAGGNPKRRAFQAWNARLAEGHPSASIIDGIKRYRRYCEATGKVGTEFVRQTSTFFNSDEAFLEAWEPPKQDKSNSDGSVVWCD